MSHENEPQHVPTAAYDEAALDRARALVEALPEQIGPYRILERIGVGGMGDVFRAQQRTPIRREVAIKSIKLGMDSRAVIARFEAERQALALMDHPHIAKVLDAGTDEAGRPYFVMEYVKGKPLTEYADQNKLTIRERLELFEQVCHAIQHAHHKGIIHRDLKPSNVLVSTQDGKAFAKVIDFGIAKAVSQSLTDKTLFTRHDQFIGTPQYMSPEQAEGSIDIDTRTDVYSLGVLLYELLTGTPPFSTADLKAAAFEQFKKLIIEVDPPSPSARLSQSTDTLPTLAAVRSVEPRRLGPIVRGELDWIVMKALEKDRRRRYDSPVALANDVHAHQHGEAVVAAPVGQAYRVRKFLRRHKGPVAAFATVNLALLLGLSGTLWGLQKARRAALEAQEINKELEGYTDSLRHITEQIWAQMWVAENEVSSMPLNASVTSQGSYRIWASNEDGQVTVISGFVIGDKKDPSNQQVVEIHETESPSESRRDLMKFLESQPLYLARLAGESRKKLIAARDAEIRQREAAERSFAVGLLRPFGDSAASLSGMERLALKEWAGISEARLRLLPLEVALSDPDIALRIAVRAKYLVQAGVGLSPTRRKQTLALTSAKQLDQTADPRIRAAACWLALVLGSDDLPAFEETLQVLSQPEHLAQRVQHDDLGSINRWALFAHDACQMTVPTQRSVVIRAVPGLVDTVKNSKDRAAVGIALNALVELAPHQELSQVGPTWDALVAILKNDDNEAHLPPLCETLAVLASRLESSKVVPAWNFSVENLKIRTLMDGRPNVGRPMLKALASRLEPFQIGPAWDAQVTSLKTGTDDEALAAGEALTALAPRLERSRIGAACDELVGILKTENGFYAGQALVALAPRLDSQVGPASDALVEVLRAGTVWRDIGALPGLVLRLELSRVGPMWDALISILKTETDDLYVANTVGDMLATLVPHLEASQIGRAWDALVAILKTEADWFVLTNTRNVMVALAPRLDPSQAGLGWDVLVAIQTTGGKYVPDVLAALAPRLELSKVGSSWDALLRRQRGEDILALRALAALAPRVRPSEVGPAWNAQIAILNSSEACSTVGKTLAVLAPLLEPPQIGTAAETLVATLKSRPSNGADFDAASRALAAMAPRLETSYAELAWDTGVAAIKTWGPSNLFRPDFSDEHSALAPLFDEAALRNRAHIWLDDLPDLPCPLLDHASARTIAELLSHPNMLQSGYRDQWLMRFEELVLHDGRRVFPREEDDDKPAPGSPPTTATVPPPRQFHTVYDAADWIEKNWPDFDLENTPRIQRGPRTFDLSP